MSDLAAAQDRLRTIFGFAEFRPGQADIVSAILDGRDVLAVMPTGSGKSLAISFRRSCATGSRSSCRR
jgi:ATP-dependent DNA helicase RecQ